MLHNYRVYTLIVNSLYICESYHGDRRGVILCSRTVSTPVHFKIMVMNPFLFTVQHIICKNHSAV